MPVTMSCFMARYTRSPSETAPLPEAGVAAGQETLRGIRRVIFRVFFCAEPLLLRVLLMTTPGESTCSLAFEYSNFTIATGWAFYHRPRLSLMKFRNLPPRRWYTICTQLRGAP